MNHLDAACFGVAGTTLGASPCRFPRHTRYLEHIIPILHGRGSTWNTYMEISGRLRTFWDTWAPPVFAWLALRLEHLNFVFRHKGGISSISVPSGVARAALGANHLHIVCGGSTWSTFMEVRGGLRRHGSLGCRLLLRGKRVSVSACHVRRSFVSRGRRVSLWQVDV